MAAIVQLIKGVLSPNTLSAQGGAPPGGGPGEGVDNLLLETGDHLILESGTPDVLLLE